MGSRVVRRGHGGGQHTLQKAAQRRAGRVVEQMYYGDKTFDDNRTNIYSKQLEVGEMFSVHYDVDDPNADIVFQIEEIIFY